MWKMMPGLFRKFFRRKKEVSGNGVLSKIFNYLYKFRASSIALDRKSRELDFRFFYLDRDVDLIEAVFCRIMGSVVLSESGRTPGKQAVPP